MLMPSTYRSTSAALIAREYAAAQSLRKVRASKSMTALLAASAAVALLCNSPVLAQQASSRWQPWAGCWTPSVVNNNSEALPSVGSTAGATLGMLCVVPVTEDNAVDLVTVSNNRVVHRERVSASGSQVQRMRDNCPGWESATWSADNRRVLLRSEYTCGGTTKVTGSGVFAISSEGDFIQIQGTKIGANSNSRVVRYQPANVELALTPGAALTDSSAVRTRPFTSSFATSATRTAAAEPVDSKAIAEVARVVDAPVTIAWINEIDQRYNVDGKELLALANAGVSPTVIDMMVALSYPEKFSVRRNDGVGGGGGSGARVADRSPRNERYSDWDCGYGSRMMQYGYYGDSCYPGYGFGVDPYYGSYGFNRYGYGYSPYNYYYGYQPVVIVPAGSGGGASGSQTTHGRAVKGAGYTAGSSDSKGGDARTTTRAPASATSGSTSSSGSGSSSSGSSGSSSSGSGSGETRTAKPRTPPPNR